MCIIKKSKIKLRKGILLTTYIILLTHLIQCMLTVWLCNCLTISMSDVHCNIDNINFSNVRKKIHKERICSYTGLWNKKKYSSIIICVTCNDFTKYEA